MLLDREVDLGPGDIVLDGDPAPLLQRGTGPQFLAHVCSGQTAGWIKMPLVTEVGLGPGHIVLDGNPAPLKRGTAPPPLFGPYLLWLNGWMDQDATWYGGRPRPRPHCVIWGPSSPLKRAQQPPPLFGPCILWPNGRPSQLLLSICTNGRPKTVTSLYLDVIRK